MPNLADNFIRNNFVQKLTLCEEAIQRRSYRLDEWEQQFIGDLRERFDSREDAEDMGLAPWNPTVSQMNTLTEIWMKAKR